MPTIGQSLLQAKENLKNAGVESYALDADLLLAYVLDKSREYVILERDHPLSKTEASAYYEVVTRRSKREPLSHIVGKREFWGRDFKVNSNVLDPRPDSEILIESVLESYSDKTQQLNFLELGVGSGCLTATLLLELPNATAVAVDVSPEALEVAGANLQTHGLASRMKVLESNWFSNIEGQYDFIISNPPYVNKDDIDQLSPEVKNYEPHQALFAEERGLADYKRIASGAAQYLKDGGKIFLEMGQGQLGDIRTVFESEGFIYVAHWNDLARIERAICFSFSSTS